MLFTLRPYHISDLDSLVQYGNNPKIAANMTDRFPNPYTEEEGKKFIAFATQHSPIRLFAISIDGKAAGGIGLHAQEDIHSRNMELGYWLAEPFWGKGIVSSAISQMVEYGFKTFDITRIFARPFGTNIGSQRVLEKAGFKLEARFEKTLFKNEKFLDELVYAIRK